MKTSTAALAILLVAVLCYQASSSPWGVRFGSCCYKYATKEVPLHRIVKYEYTGSHCHQPAVIFTTVQRKRVCGRPGDKWVQDILNHHNNAGSG
ncbi:C-C motif chemokine 5-like [Melopsittacus undulatus]|uniref:C-C motif chemokine 5-like n=1 Tax=Melopsittacus undulatus TaxID=13146 RepID=UPI00146D8C8B|nr:C-C motif chemokine 5-like [Melopsittacus undulatus]